MYLLLEIWEKTTKDTKDIVASANDDKIDFIDLAKSKWAYPLPGSSVLVSSVVLVIIQVSTLRHAQNDNICSAFDGVVTMSGNYCGYGNCIKIKHNNGLETLYGDQSRNLVRCGDKVKAGQIIGFTGRTGHATTEHLHFEIFFKGHRLNP